MKKAFIGFVIISTTILLSFLAAALILRITREGLIITDPQALPISPYTLLDETEFDFLNTNIAKVRLNQAIRFNELISVEPTDNFEGALVAIGLEKNASDINNGLVQLYTFSQSQNSIITPALADEFVDDTEAYESEYLVATTINTSVDGTTNKPMISALEEINKTIFEVDFFSLSSNNIALNFSYTIPSIIINSSFGINVLDINNDGLQELYVLGENITNSIVQHVLVEFKYNVTSKSFYYSQSVSWDASNQELIDMTIIQNSDSVDFIITGVDTSSGIQTYLMVITLDRSVTRQFNISSSVDISLDSDIFRVYSLNLLHSRSLENPKVVLFGTYYSGGAMLPSCLVIPYVSGGFGEFELVINQDSPLTWSLDGIVIDIDLDNSEDIVLTSFDPFGATNSSIVLLTESENELLEVNKDITDLLCIRSCTTLHLTNTQIAIWVGESSEDEVIIEFFAAQHVPLRIKGSSEILLEESNYLLSIETTDLTGTEKTRNDLTISASLRSRPNMTKTLASAPGNISLLIPQIDQQAVEESIIVLVSKGLVTLGTFEIPKIIDFTPSFQVRLPHSPVVLSAPAEIPMEISFENRMSSELSVNLSIEAIVSNTTNSYQFVVQPNARESYDVSISVIMLRGEGAYMETLSIIIASNAGTFQFLTQIEAAVKFFYLSVADIINIFWIGLGLAFVSYLVSGVLIFNQNRKVIQSHIETDTPLELELPWFKGPAISSLLNKYQKEGNWQFGVKIAAKYRPEQLRPFLELKVKHHLLAGQTKANEGQFALTLDHWLAAHESLEKIGEHQWLDTLDWLLQPLQRIVEIKSTMKGAERAASLLKEFQNLSSMERQNINVLGVELSIPLYLVAEEVGLAYRDARELQSSLNYLQLGYQGAPDHEKSRIVTEITGLISLGVIPAELSLPVNQEAIRKRIEKRTIRCFSCGEERANINEACPNCGIETVFCSVCKLPISFGANWAECPHCGHMAHREHLLEWIKVKGTCPICQQKLLEDELTDEDSDQT